MRRALLLLFPALLFGQTPPVVQDRDKASLEGQALNSATGEPIRKVRVTLKMNVAPPQTTRQQQPPAVPPPPSVTVMTDTAGKFLFSNPDPVIINCWRAAMGSPMRSSDAMARSANQPCWRRAIPRPDSS